MEEILFWTGIALIAARFVGFPLWGKTIDQIKFSQPPAFAPGARRPVAAVVLSCRGVHPGLERAVEQLMHLDYPVYDVVFATENEDDPACPAIQRMLTRIPGRRARHVRFAFGGISGVRAQKLDNHLAALDATASDIEVFVFVDDDGAPPADFLTQLIAPLDQEGVGMTTGWPWLSRPSGFYTRLAALWFVGLISSTGSRKMANGVAMAVRRETFDRAGVRGLWERALTDDLSLAAAVAGIGQEVAFVPQVMLRQSAAHSSPTSLWTWIVRQIMLCRLYAPKVWRNSFIAYALPSFAAWLGIAWLAIAGTHSTAGWILFSQIPLSLFDTFVGLMLVRNAFHRAGTRAEIADGLPAHQAILMPFVTLMIFPVYLRSWLVPRMRWGDLVYEVASPTHVRARRVDGRPLPPSPVPATTRAAA